MSKKVSGNMATTESERKREDNLFLGENIFTFDFGGGGSASEKEEVALPSDSERDEEEKSETHDDAVVDKVVAEEQAKDETDQERGNRALQEMERTRNRGKKGATGTQISAEEVQKACDKFFPMASNSFLALGKKTWKEAWGEYARHLHDGLGKLYAAEAAKKKMKKKSGSGKQGKSRDNNKGSGQKKTRPRGGGGGKQTGRSAGGRRQIEIITPKAA